LPVRRRLPVRRLPVRRRLPLRVRLARLRRLWLRRLWLLSVMWSLRHLLRKHVVQIMSTIKAPASMRDWLGLNRASGARPEGGN
jgi:hypothetical protein